MGDNKETIIERYFTEIAVLAFFLFAIFIYLMFSHMAEIQDNKIIEEDEAQIITFKEVVVKCFVINKVTTKYWDVENNVFVGGNSYIENSTEINCDEFPK